MIILLCIVLMMAAYGLNVRRSGLHEDYIGYQTIQPIKGIFILLVFFSHFAAYVSLNGVWDQPYFAVRSYLGQLIVAPFLFFSGYGVAESIRKKGYAYTKRLPLHRIGKVLLQFSIAVLLFLILQLILGKRYSVTHVLLSLIGVTSLGNSNWYIFAIVCLYAATWFSFFLFRKHTLPALLFVTVLTGGYIAVLIKTGTDAWWYNTAAAYVFGMWFSYLRKPLEKVFLSHWAAYGLCLLGTAAPFLCCHIHRQELVFYELHSVLFSLVIVLLSCKIKICNKALSYCGEHLFSPYILQRLPMIALDNTAIEKYPAVYFAVCLAITFALSWVFDKAMDKLWNTLTKPKKDKI